jgi:hypothetical protein
MVDLALMQDQVASLAKEAESLRAVKQVTQAL